MSVDEFRQLNQRGDPRIKPHTAETRHIDTVGTLDKSNSSMCSNLAACYQSRKSDSI